MRHEHDDKNTRGRTKFPFDISFSGFPYNFRRNPYANWCNSTFYTGLATLEPGYLILGLRSGTRKPSIPIRCPRERCFASIPFGINAWASCCNCTNHIFITALIFMPALRRGTLCRVKIQRIKLCFACYSFCTMRSTKALFRQTWFAEDNVRSWRASSMFHRNLF